MNKNMVCAALAAAVLSACGGGAANREKLIPGDEFSLELSLDDRLAETSTYRAYGISKAGQLVTVSGDLASESLIPIEISRSGSMAKATDAALPDIAAIQGFFPQLWLELAKRHGVSSAHVTFVPDTEIPVFEAAGYLHRTDQQFHWPNRGFRRVN